MSYTTITPMDTTISALDMHGNTVPPFVPFSVRGPQFIELKDGILLYMFDAKYTTTLDEEPSAKVLMRSHDGGRTYKPIKKPSPQGEFAGYSALQATREGKLLCAWETDSGNWEDRYRSINYVILDLAELTN